MHTREVRMEVKWVIVMNPMSRKTSTLSLRLVPSPTALSTVWMSWEVDGAKANVHSEIHEERSRDPHKESVEGGMGLPFSV